MSSNAPIPISSLAFPQHSRRRLACTASRPAGGAGRDGIEEHDQPDLIAADIAVPEGLIDGSVGRKDEVLAGKEVEAVNRALREAFAISHVGGAEEAAARYLRETGRCLGIVAESVMHLH